MKVIVIKDLFYPSNLANVSQTLGMVNAFASLGRVEFWVPDKKVNDKLPVAKAVTVKKVTSFLKKSNFIIFQAFSSYLFKLSFYLQIFKLLRKENNGVIYSREPEAVVLAALRKSNLTVYEFHQQPTHWYDRFWHFWAIRCADQVIVISNGLRQLYSKIDIAVLPDAVEKDWIDKSINEKIVHDYVEKYHLSDKKIIMYAGSNLSWKGVDTFIKTSTIDNDKNHLYLIVGFSGKVTNNLLYIDRVKRDVLFSLYSIADVLVLPNTAKSEISRSFTSPLKLFEYMAAKKPIICSNIPSLKEILSDEDVWFFEPDNTGSLLDTINKVLNEREFVLSNKIKSSYIKVLDFTWDKRAERIIKLAKSS